MVVPSSTSGSETARRKKIAPAASTPMTFADNVFFALDEPGVNNMMIAGCWVFEDALSEDTVIGLLMRWVTSYPVFTQRPMPGYWEAALDFDLAHHVKFVRLPAPYGRNELEAVMTKTVQEPLRPDQPMWRVVVVTNYYENQWAIMTALHHAYGDGLSTMRSVLTQCMDPREMQDMTYVEAKKKEKGEEHEEHERKDRLRSMSDYLFETVQWIVFTLSDLLFLVLKLYTLTVQPRGVLTRKGGYAKEMAMSDPIPLHDIKAVCRAQHATVNDVLVAALTRAFRGYFLHTGELESLRAFFVSIPVSMRLMDDFTPGNKISQVLAQLPVHIEDPLETLKAVQVQMDNLKTSWEMMLSYIMLNVAGLLPQAITRPFFDFYKRRVHAVLTNVAGPRHSVLLDGHKTVGYYGLPPQPGAGGLGIAIVSFHYKVTIAVLADHSHLQPSAQSFIKMFHREFEALRSAARITTVCPSARGRVCMTCAKHADDHDEPADGATAAAAAQ